uniref:Fatty-acid and retinol-binding protein 1 n=1 Tax=Rhabditophanes sp. KR3021 TaxID=114890 RepID=A0AC35TIU6_9BILA
MRTFAIIAALAAFAAIASCYVIPATLDGIPDKFKPLIPEEFKTFFAGLSEQDKKDVAEWAMKYESYDNNVETALDALRGVNPKLFEQITALRQLVTSKIDSLDAEAKSFVESTIELLKSLRPAAGAKPDIAVLKTHAQNVIAKYAALSPEAKNNLKATFPRTYAVLENDEIQTLFKGLIAA